MRRDNLSEIEELVLLIVGALHPEAYAVNVLDTLADEAQRRLNVTTVHAMLTRLESKGFVKSKMGEPTEERGGRRKRIYVLTWAGKKVITHALELRTNLFKKIPSMSF